MTNDISTINKLNSYAYTNKNSNNFHKSKNEAALDSLVGVNKSEATFFTKTSVDPVNLTADKILEKINKKLHEKYNVSDEATSTDKTEETNILTDVDDSMVKAVDNMIAAFSSLYVAYNRSHNNPDTEEMLKDFMNAIRKGVKEGYEEAVDILKSGNEYSSPIEQRINTFMRYLNSRIDDFETEQAAALKTKNAITEIM